MLAGERLFSSDLAARLLSFAATLAVFGGALLLPSRPSKLRFVLLASLSPLVVLYSAEARAYALLSVLVLALFLLAVEVARVPPRLAALALLSAALLYTHYLAIFAVGAAVAVAAAEKRLRSALAVVAGSLLFLFWVPVMLRQPRAAVAWMRAASRGARHRPAVLVRGGGADPRIRSDRRFPARSWLSERGSRSSSRSR